MLKFIATRQGSLNNFHRQSSKTDFLRDLPALALAVCQRAPVLKKKIKTLLISQIYAAAIKNIEV